ncbi:hypothetical protein LCGC14_2377750 [marine sediment metagenome]|uniref:Uncharacterized protein n=1 Tax=marine sediment metagenome TaxID=412755 RepID=A0A0F9CP26_9ZZZZ
MAKDVYRIDGIRPSIARRILKHVFNGYFFKLQMDKKEKEFKVWMLSEVDGVKIDREDILYFKEHYYGFNFIIINPEELEMI